MYRPLVPMLALYPELVRAQFPPHQTDLDVLDAAWKGRLSALRAAGAEPVKKRSSFDRAMACRPHAFAYAENGTPCRFWFCPYCNAADAVEAFARLRKARRAHGGRFGFYLSHARLRVPAAELSTVVRALLSPVPKEVLRIRGVKVFGAHALNWGTAHALVRVGVHPGRFYVEGGSAELSVRVVSAIDRAAAARAADDAQRNNRRLNASERRFRARCAADGAGPSPDADRDDECPSDPEAYTCPQDNSGYLIRPTPVSDARAAAHLCRYTAEILTGPVEQAAEILNRSAGIRQSATRGVFRSATDARRPEGRPTYVRVTTGGSLVGPLAPCIPDISEQLAAQGFARDLGLPDRDSFEAIGRDIGWKCYWIGSHELNLVELFGVKLRSPFGRMVQARRPKRPDKHHLLVVSTSLGYLVFWTPARGETLGPHGLMDASFVDQPITYFPAFKLGRRCYRLAPVALFRLLAQRYFVASANPARTAQTATAPSGPVAPSPGTS